jgi:hypothetical protein
VACGPSGLETQSIKKGGGIGSLWDDRTGAGQLDAFGFNLVEKYETEYLIGVEDGFTDRVSIHIYQVKDSDVKSISDLFKSNEKYLAKSLSPTCHHNRFSEKTTEKK